LYIRLVYNYSRIYSPRGKNGNQKESKEEGKESCEEAQRALRLLQVIFHFFVFSGSMEKFMGLLT